MNKNLIIAFVASVFFAVLLVSCKKDGLNSDTAKKIQYKWERLSISSATDYLNGRPLHWTLTRATTSTYIDFNKEGYFLDIYANGGSTKYWYKVDGDKIFSLHAVGSSEPTTPQYTDTAFIKHVDDHLLVLFHRKYFLSSGYNYIDLSIDSLKR